MEINTDRQEVEARIAALTASETPSPDVQHKIERLQNEFNDRHSLALPSMREAQRTLQITYGQDHVITYPPPLGLQAGAAHYMLPGTVQ